MKFIYCLFVLATLATLCHSNAQQENPPTNGCHKFCELTYIPICGTDDAGKTKTFPNECVMKTENCVNKLNYQKTANGTCP